MSRQFKLTEEDKKYLSSIGYPSTDFKQIEESVGIATFKKTNLTTNKKSRVKFGNVISVLGRKPFLASMGRATFHCSTCDECNGILIEFEVPWV